MNIKKYIAMDMSTVQHMGRVHIGQIGEEYADKCLILYAREAMEERLQKQRKDGQHGWWDNNQCSIETLKQLLVDNVLDEDMVNVMNIAAMIYARECANSSNTEYQGE